MEKEIDNMEEEDFNIDDLLSEDEDSPAEDNMVEKVSTPKKKKGRPSGTANKANVPKEDTHDVPVEVANTEKDLLGMEWQSLSQVAYEGYQNIKTGEVIDQKEAIRRCLCYSMEAARNTR